MLILLIISIILSINDVKFATELDYAVLIIFAFDSFYALYKSDNKWLYFRKHLLDFISLIPISPLFRAFRIVPILMHLIQITSVGKRYLLPTVNDFKQTVIGRFLFSFLIIFFVLPLPMYWIEPAVKTYADLLWWSLQTVTTVGYGDILITHDISRVIAAILMFLGIGMISTFTSSITKLMTHPKKALEEMASIEKTEIIDTKSALSLDDLERLEKLIKQEKEKLQKTN